MAHHTGARTTAHRPDASTVTVARAPLRVGFAGGGTDNELFAAQHRGAVLNAAIGSFVHAWVSIPDVAGDQPFRTHDVRRPDSVSDVEDLPLHEAAWRWFAESFLEGEVPPIAITSSSDVPRGSGLGASSALTVAILRALAGHFGVPMTRMELAANAYYVERVVAAVVGGKQDHYSAAFGGVNYLEFFHQDRVAVSPVIISDEVRASLESRMTLVFSGATRLSATLIDRQQGAIAASRDTTISTLEDMVLVADEARHHLTLGELDRFVSAVDKSAELKRLAAPGAYSRSVDEVVDVAASAGAEVCKVSGAGGGGFVMIMTGRGSKRGLHEALWGAGYEPRNVTIQEAGATAWREASSASEGDLSLDVRVSIGARD